MKRVSRSSAAFAAFAVLVLCLPGGADAALDLGRASTERLGNGLTVVVLEEHTLPLVSVQMLYRVGARDEPAGRTGIAHFLEHMAFRATENFPDTDVVGAIYAAGGEWHGYTWLDQTTYFETLPAADLDLALRIEADRMSRLILPAADVEAERGAVLAEMHGYENDPATRLKDAVLQVSFLQHPYRNNTIGWESDVESLEHRDLVSFYRRHYRPANAVLAVVGAVSTPEVLARIRELFGSFPAAPPSEPPSTVEPPQHGRRRVELEIPEGPRRFEAAYRAPGVGHPDYPGFLVMQKILGGGAGVNFLQNEWGDTAPAGSRLAGLTDHVATWFIPTRFPYVLTIAGSISDEDSPAALEAGLEQVVAELRRQPPPPAELERAKRALLDELIFDVETTEDAAHQLAYFTGIDALDVLLDLPRRLTAVTPETIRDLARRYLEPDRQTIGWTLPRPAEPTEPAGVGGAAKAPAPAPEPPLRTAPVAPRPSPRGEPPPARSIRLGSGLPVVFQRLSLSPAAHLRILLPTTRLDSDAALSTDHPLWRHSAIDYRFRPGELATVLARARQAVDALRPLAPGPGGEPLHPAARLARELDSLLGAESLPPVLAPVALSLVGDLPEEESLALLESTFGDLEPAATSPPPLRTSDGDRSVSLPAPPAQAQLGYAVPAPTPGSADADAWRVLLYVLSHGYEGRLGREAISRRGLVYFIDAAYSTDGANGRVTLAIGVDPDKLVAMRELLAAELSRLRRDPPTPSEIAEAKRHLIGRRLSAAQSNEEVSARLLLDLASYGRPLSQEEYATRIESVSLEDVHRAIPAFLSGATVTVTR